MNNGNTLWANIIVDALAQAGVTYACLAPGSRNTPLTLAFANHPTVQTLSHLDERSAAYFALGLARATDTAVALVCTSGTALANFYPAVIEAHQAQIPLIILSGDRPHELRHSGANQTIDQIKIYGDNVRWFVDMGLPEAQPPALVLRNVHTTAERAVAIATGTPRGVVHLNFPFRKPLEPTPDDNLPAQITEADHTTFLHPVQTLPPGQLDWLAEVMQRHERGLIVAGGADLQRHTAQLHALSQQAGYPILADVLSGLRFDTDSALCLGGYETFLPQIAPPSPDVILRFGKLPISKALNDYLAQTSCPHYFHFTEDGVWADDAHRVSHMVQVDYAMLLRELLERLINKPSERQTSRWSADFRWAEAATWRVIGDHLQEGGLFEGALAADVVDLLPEDSILFAGNSLPIRHLDQFARPVNKCLRVYANRGASGIDGIISSALGSGLAYPDRPLALLIGDVSFYHDMNGLLAVQRLGIPITIVLFNNNGGGIFHRLPVREHEPAFTEWFITPHQLNFEHAARLYNLDYIRVEHRGAFREAFSTRITQRRASVIEVTTDARADERFRQQVIREVQNTFRNATERELL